LVFPWQQQFLVFHWLRTVNATFSISQATSISLIMAESPAQPFPASILLQISPGSWPGRNGKANFLNTLADSSAPWGPFSVESGQNRCLHLLT